jgi:GntR family transcriptional regulator, rspAB operon transcriptional repressor
MDTKNMNLPSLLDDEKLTLAERVFQSLRRGILSHEIKPREYLVIGEVAKQYNISRTPVREALIKLEREGWLESDGRRGAKVTVTSSKTFLELVETQAALESYMANQAALKLSDEQLDILQLNIDESRELFTKGNIVGSRKKIDEFHFKLYFFLDNKYMLDTVKKLEEKVNRVRITLWNKGEAPIGESIEQHNEILQAIRDHNPEKAYKMMLHHTMWFEEELAEIYRYI